MAKTLCSYKHKSIIKNDFKKYRDLVYPGKYVCKNCGRVAKKEDNLCDPKHLQPTAKKKE
jgi:hypothetical protein